MRGPVRTLAATRGRLAAAFGIGILPVFGFAWWAADYIRHHSGSPSVDLVLILAWMFMSLAVAWLGALLVADFVFPAGWREVNILGRQPQANTDDEAELARVTASAKGQAFPFAVIVTVLVGLIVGGTWLATGDFFGWYARYGYATSTLRGDDAERKVAILAEMTRAQDDRLIEYTHMMEAALADPDAPASVREQAIWSLGEVGRRMTRSIDLMEQGQKGAKWVYGLQEHLQKAVVPKLVGAFASGPPEGQGPALVFALGAMRAPEAGPLYRQWLERGINDDEMLKAIIMATAMSGDVAEGIPLLRPLLLSSNPEVASRAAWAIGELYGLGSGTPDEAPPDPALVETLQAHLNQLPFEVQCAVLDALVRLRAEELDAALFTLFDGVNPPDRRCPRQEADRPFQAPVVISKEEELREKVLQGLGAIAQGNSEVIAWLRRRMNDDSVAQGLRDDMGYILDVLRGRDTVM